MKLALYKIQSIQILRALALGGAILAGPAAALGQMSYAVSNAVGSFLATGPSGGPNLEVTNFGGAGTFAIAPASSPKGEFDGVLMFNTGAAVSQFNSQYGIGNWTITGITLSLASQFGLQGAKPGNIFNTINAGNFGVDFLTNNSWSPGTGGGMGGTGYPYNNAVTYADKPNLLAGSDSLGTFAYTPPGNNVYITYTLPLDGNLVDNSAAGGEVSLYFYAADNQVSYLFNSNTYAQNHPEFTLTAEAVPESGAAALFLAGLSGLLVVRRRKENNGSL